MFFQMEDAIHHLISSFLDSGKAFFWGTLDSLTTALVSGFLVASLGSELSCTEPRTCFLFVGAEIPFAIHCKARRSLSS